MEKIIINTQKRNKGSVSHGSVLLDDWVKGTYNLNSVVFANNLYNINQYNNQLTFSINSGAQSTITLDNGYYNVAEFINMFNMKSAIVATYNAITNKITFTQGANTIQFYFEGNDNTCYKILGFDYNTDYLLVSVAPNCLDLIPVKIIFVVVEEDSGKKIYGNRYFRASIFVRDANNSSYGGIFYYENVANTLQTITFERRTREISYRFYDEDFNLLDFNGNNVSMIFEKID